MARNRNRTTGDGDSGVADSSEEEKPGRPAHMSHAGQVDKKYIMVAWTESGVEFTIWDSIEEAKANVPDAAFAAGTFPVRLEMLK